MIELPMVPTQPAQRQITLTIDDQQVEVPEGSTILDACKQARDRHADAVLRRDADPGERVPDLRGRDGRGADAGARVLAHGRGRTW